MSYTLTHDFDFDNPLKKVRDLASYYADFRTFKNKGIEVVLRAIKPSNEERIKYAGCIVSDGVSLKPISDEEREANRLESFKRNVQRSKRKIRWLIKHGEFDRLFTLTYRENVLDRERVFSDFTRFLRLVRKDLPDWAYVAVLEKQERGAYHIHCAVRGYQPIKKLRACWFKALGGSGDERGSDTPGNIDVTPPRSAKGNYAREWGSQADLASYLCKYLSKTFDDADSSKRRYWQSKDLSVPEKDRFFLKAQNIEDAFWEVYGMMAAYSVKPSFNVMIAPDSTLVWFSGDMERPEGTPF